jgi:hypothetical protein
VHAKPKRRKQGDRSLFTVQTSAAAPMAQLLTANGLGGLSVECERAPQLDAARPTPPAPPTSPAGAQPFPFRRAVAGQSIRAQAGHQQWRHQGLPRPPKPPSLRRASPLRSLAGGTPSLRQAQPVASASISPQPRCLETWRGAHRPADGTPSLAGNGGPQGADAPARPSSAHCHILRPKRSSDLRKKAAHEGRLFQVAKKICARG